MPGGLAVRMRLAVWVCALLPAVGACGSDHPSSEPQGAVTIPTAGPDETYAVFPSGVPVEGWSFNTAARQEDPDSADILDEIEGIRWSAEYEDLRHASDTDPYIKIDGIERPLAAVGESDSASETAGEVGGRPARWGSDPTDPEGSIFVIVALTPSFSLELTAYNMTLDELRQVAATLRPATAERWISVHGVTGVH